MYTFIIIIDYLIFLIRISEIAARSRQVASGLTKLGFRSGHVLQGQLVAPRMATRKKEAFDSSNFSQGKRTPSEIGRGNS